MKHRLRLALRGMSVSCSCQSPGIQTRGVEPTVIRVSRINYRLSGPLMSVSKITRAARSAPGCSQWMTSQ